MPFAQVEEAINTIKTTIYSKFPSLQNVFHEGLSLSDIEEFETKYGLKLPEDVVDYLQLVNGENQACDFVHQHIGDGSYDDDDDDEDDDYDDDDDDEDDDQEQEAEQAKELEKQHQELAVFFGLKMLSLEGIKREYEILKEQSGNEEYIFRVPTYPEGSIRPTQTSRYWVALAYDECGNSIGVDLKPGPNGKQGQVILWGKDFLESRVVVADSWLGFLQQFAADLKNEDLCEVHPEHPQGIFIKKYGFYNDYLFKTKLKEYTAM